MNPLHLDMAHLDFAHLAFTHLFASAKSLWILGAPATTSGDATEPAPWWANGGLILPIAVVLLLFVMMNKGGRGGGDKAQAELLKNLKRGDRIQTIGGVLGTVNDVRDNEVVVKVDETSNIKMRFARDAIRKVIVEDDKAVEVKK